MARTVIGAAKKTRAMEAIRRSRIRRVRERVQGLAGGVFRQFPQEVDEACLHGCGRKAEVSSIGFYVL